jgi:hypothetical protein
MPYACSIKGTMEPLNRDEQEFAAPLSHGYFPPPAPEFFLNAKVLCPQLFAWTIVNYADDKATFFGLMAILFTHYHLEVLAALMWGWALKTCLPVQRRVLVAAQELLYTHSLSTPNDTEFLTTKQDWSRILFSSPTRYWARYCQLFLVTLRQCTSTWQPGRSFESMIPCAQCATTATTYCDFCGRDLCQRCHKVNMTLVNPETKCITWSHHQTPY